MLYIEWSGKAFLSKSHMGYNLNEEKVPIV